MFTSLISLAMSAVLSINPVLAYPTPAPSPAFANKAASASESEHVQRYVVEKRVSMTLTAYSSSIDETDDTPFITAWGTRTRNGVAASNDLPFGTRTRIPGVFGEKVFAVEDRMNKRYTGRNYLDLWMPSKGEALRFGLVRNTTVEILGE